MSSLSAELDGEHAAVSPKRLRAHVKGCADCAQYETAAKTLSHQLGHPRSSMRVAAMDDHEAEINRLMPAVHLVGAELSARSRPVRAASVRRRLQGKRRWLIPLVPAFVLATAMPLGAAESFHPPDKHPALCHLIDPAPHPDAS